VEDDLNATLSEPSSTVAGQDSKQGGHAFRVIAAYTR
jgi:hypothetical protein